MKQSDFRQSTIESIHERDNATSQEVGTDILSLPTVATIGVFLEGLANTKRSGASLQSEENMFLEAEWTMGEELGEY